MPAKRKKSSAKSKPSSTLKKVHATTHVTGLWKYYVPVLIITFAIFIPALNNTFTNWDDILYVTQNPLLRAFNAESLKAIFSTPVVSNYHPITILSLAINYQLAELTPWTYHLTSMILHTVNTGLVFWFIYLLSGKNAWISAIVALMFGIHPMHVESVAWVSERKDLLYTLFYLLAMIVYMRYVRENKIKTLILVTVFAALSILSKPAAIILPLSLLLIDYYTRRPWSMKWIVEKIPLFVLSGIMTYVTFAIQAKRAVASVEMHNITERISYAGFGWVWYLLKAVVPVPLSALHPYPSTPGAVYYLSTIVAVAITLYALWKIRNRHFLFGFGFYTVNLILVLQLISIGNAVVAERYTYMPYIGIFFWAAMEVYGRIQGKWVKFKKPVMGVLAIWILFLSFLTLQRIPVWKNSQTLWADVLETYPDAKRAWTNKGLDFYDQRKWPEVVDHLTRALAIDSLYPDALEWRGKAFLELKDAPNALRDASLFYRMYAHKESAQFLMARAFEANGQVDQALDLYNKLIGAYPKPEYFNNRGVILFNRLQRFAQAKTDFEESIRLSPRNGSYYLNLSRCYYMLSDLDQARALAVKARELGHEVDEAYGRLIGL